MARISYPLRFLAAFTASILALTLGWSVIGIADYVFAARLAMWWLPVCAGISSLLISSLPCGKAKLLLAAVSVILPGVAAPALGLIGLHFSGSEEASVLGVLSAWSPYFKSHLFGLLSPWSPHIEFYFLSSLPIACGLVIAAICRLRSSGHF